MSKEWYMAMNKNRKWHLFTAEPIRFENKWLVCEGEGEAYPVDKHFPKAENWKKSCYKLVKVEE